MAAQPTRRGMRRLGLVVAGAAAVALVIYLAAVVVLRALLDPASLADRLEPHLSAALNRTVSVGSAQVRVFPRPELRLLRLRVDNLSDFEGLPLATVDELGLRPRLLPLLGKRVEIDRVSVIGPRVLFQVDEAGRTNFGDFVPESSDTAAPTAPIVLEVRGIEVRDGRLGYRDAVKQRTVQADGVRIDGSVSRGADGTFALDLASSADSLRFALPPAWRRGLRGVPFEASVKATADPQAAWAVVETGRVDVGGLRLSLAGRIDSLKSSPRILDLRLTGQEVDVSRVVEAFPDSVRDALDFEVWGTMDVDLAIRGPAGVDRHPDVEGLIALRDAGFRRTQRPLFEDARLEIHVADGRATASGFRALLPGGEVAGNGWVALDSTLAFSAAMEGAADLPGLLAAAGSAGPGPSARSGRLHIDGSLTGAVPRPAATRASGRLELADLEVAGGRLVSPVTVPAAALDLEGTSARWRGVEVRTQGGAISLDGSVRDLFGALAEQPRSPVVEASAFSRRLDLDALIGRPRDDIGYGRLAWARLGNSSVSGRAPEEWARERDLRRPVDVPVRGRVSFRVDSLIRRPYEMSAVQGVLILEPDRIDLQDTRFSVYGGTGTATGGLALGSEVAEPFRLDLALRGVRAEQYLAHNSPLGNLISGGLTLDVSLAGEVDSLALPLTRALQGAGSFEIRDGRIRDNPLTRGVLSFLGLDRDVEMAFSRWTSPFTIRDGAMVLSGSRFAGSTLAASLQGALGFGGSLDLAALLTPDPAVARQAVAGGAAGDVMRSFVDSGGVLEIALRLTGQASDPRVDLDPSAMGRSSRTVLERAAGEAARSAEDEVRQRGLDLLNRLGGRRDAADSAALRLPQDSAGARGAPADTGPAVPQESPGGR